MDSSVNHFLKGIKWFLHLLWKMVELEYTEVPTNLCIPLYFLCQS